MVFLYHFLKTLHRVVSVSRVTFYLLFDLLNGDGVGDELDVLLHEVLKTESLLFVQELLR